MVRSREDPLVEAVFCGCLLHIFSEDVRGLGIPKVLLSWWCSVCRFCEKCYVIFQRCPFTPAVPSLLSVIVVDRWCSSLAEPDTDTGPDSGLVALRRSTDRAADHHSSSIHSFIHSFIHESSLFYLDRQLHLLLLL